MQLDAKGNYTITAPLLCPKSVRVACVQPTNGTSIITTKPNGEYVRDSSIYDSVRPNDYCVFSKNGDTRHMVGMVRKCDGRVMWRKTTNNGMGAWHVLRGYTKRMPEKVMRDVFGVKPYLTCYMVDVAHIIKVNDRETLKLIRLYGPHDRRPQEYIYKARYPKHK